MFRSPLALSAAVWLTFSPSPSLAAESQPSGFYAGINLGYGAGEDEVTEINGPRIYFPDTGNVVGGVLVGWQTNFDKIVAGVELEGGLLGQSGDIERSDAFAHVQSTIDYDAYATLSGRLGVRLGDEWTVYGRLGVTVAELEARTFESCPTPDPCAFTPSVATTQDSTWGYTIGAGVERQLSRQWSIRLEYQYTDFREELALPDGGGPGPGWTHDIDLHAVKAGLNFHF
jgi:opacity protein-like surface antigen